jgi:hypothetical protein
MAGREISVKLLGDTRSLERAFSKAGNSGSTFSSGMGKVGHGLGTVVKGAALAGAAVVGLGVIIGTKLVQDMASQQKMSVQTNTVIASTGGVANVTRKHVEDLATAIQNKSGIDDQAAQSGANMLLTFTNLRNEAGKGNKIFDQSVNVLQDMTVALGSDPQKQAIQLGKALNDPVKGIGALQRVGVTFTEGQKKTIAAMVKAGDTIGAQKVILKELNKEFGGSARALGQTLPGKINILKGRLMDIGTSIAKGVMPHLSHFVGFLNRIVSAPNMTVRMKIVWEGIKEFAANAAKVVGDALFGSSRTVHIGGGSPHVVVDPGLIASLSAGIKEAITNIDWTAAGKAIAKGIGNATKGQHKDANWKSTLDTFASDALPAVDNFSNKLANRAGHVLGKGLELALGGALLLGIAAFNDPGKAIAVGGQMASAFIKGITLPLRLAHSLFQGVISETIGKAVSGALPAVKTAVRAIGTILFEGLKKMPDKALTAAARVASSIGAGIKTAPSKLAGLAGDLTKKIGAAINQVLGWVWDKAKSIGTSIADGVKAGIVNYAWGTTKSLFSTSILDLIHSGKKAAGAQSPSTKTRDEIGIPLAQGIILGFLAGSRDLPEKISDKIKSSLESARNRIDGLRSSFATSFGRLGADAMSAFDATTTKKLDVIARKFEKWRDKAAKDLAAAMGAIDASQGALTPSEQALQDLQSGHEQAGRNADLARGQADFAAATTPEEQAAAQKEIDDAVYNQRIFDLGVLATAERAKVDADSELARQRVQAAYDQQNLDWDAQQAKETLDRQSQRDLKKRHLEDMLADVQENLAKHPKAWRKAHAKIMKIFAEEFGPDFKTAGADLGTGFRNSLIEDFQVTGDLLGSVGAAIRNALSLDNQKAVGVKKMAAGGIVTRPTFALIGEAGPEAVIPLPRGGAGGGGGGVTVNVYGFVGDEQALLEKIRNGLIRTGRSTTGGALGGFA